MSPSGWANPSTLWSVLKPTIERRRTRSQSRESVAKITNRLPVGRTECRRVRNLVLRDMPAPAADDEGGGGSAHTTISDERVAEVLPWCIRLETLVLCGVSDLTDKTVALAASMPNLQGLDITGCRQVTDVGVSELAKKSQHLQWLRLGGVTNLTDATISTIAKSCSLLRELDLSDLPSLTAVSVRDLWSFSKNLNTLRLARCPLLTDKAFPSSFHTSPQTVTSGGTDKPLPPRPTTWVENLSPLILTHTADHLRELDLESCTEITDEAIAGIAAHAPKLQTLVLSGCTALTDRALGSICQLGDNLEVLMLARLAKVTDPGIVDLARKCTKIQCLDVSFCRQLTDMAVFEIAGLTDLRRLSLVRVQKLTDIAIHTLAEQATALESIQISYCDGLTLNAIHVLLRRVGTLQQLAATGVPCLRRKGTRRFSDPAPKDWDINQQAAFRVFSGDNVGTLRQFLDKEEQRRHEAESKNIKFVPRADDKLDLH